MWLNNTQKLQDEYERKLKIQSRKSYKSEQVLSLQVYKLQQDQKSLQEDKAKVTQKLNAFKQCLEEEQAEVKSLRKQLGLALPSPKAATTSARSDLGDLMMKKAHSAYSYITIPTLQMNLFITKRCYLERTIATSYVAKKL